MPTKLTLAALAVIASSACGRVLCSDIHVGAEASRLPIKSRARVPVGGPLWNTIMALEGPVHDVACCSQVNFCSNACGTPPTCNASCTAPQFSNGEYALIDNYVEIGGPEAGFYCHVWLHQDRVVAVWRTMD